MKFTVLVHTAPASAGGSVTALKFCRAVLAAGHELERVFFFRDAVHNASNNSVVPQDETDLMDQWQALIGEHNLDASVCVTSALRRGILNAEEAARWEKPAVTLQDNINIAGLGSLVDACLNADRTVSFG